MNTSLNTKMNTQRHLRLPYGRGSVVFDPPQSPLVKGGGFSGRVAAWAVACIGLAASSATAATLHVSTSGGGDCSSWAQPCSLSAALSAASSGDQIWVKAGTYSGPITLANGTKLIGGFNGMELVASASNPTANVTILDGGSSDRVIYSSDDAASTVVRGFTIQNGKDDGMDGGGALALENSGAIFVQCIFKNNVAAYFGGVLAVRGSSSPHFVNCKFHDNGSGSGTSVQPMGGGVMFVHSGTATFTNCLFHDNKAGEGGVFMTLHGIGKFYNCTIAGNQATIGDGGALFAPNGRVVVRNSVLWGNTVPSGKSGPQIHNQYGYLPSVKRCNVEGGFSGAGNINSDPLFVNPGIGQLRHSEYLSVQGRGQQLGYSAGCG